MNTATASLPVDGPATPGPRLYARRSISGRIAAGLSALLAAGVLLAAPTRGLAASTEPRFAIVGASAFGGTDSGRFSLRLETSFSFADTLQLALPLNVVVRQGTLAARLDLAGNVFTSTGGAEQPAPGPGILSVAEREILLVLPSGFVAGPAVVQLSTDVEGKTLTSNPLDVTL